MEETLLIGYGNPGRCDDGLGPAFAERVEGAALPGVRVITAYQLQVEHAWEVARAQVVVLADAMTCVSVPWRLERLTGCATTSFTTHALPPAALVALAETTFGWTGAAYLLGLRGALFDDFGERLSPTAEDSLEQAVSTVIPALRDGRLSGVVAPPGAPVAARRS